MLTQMLHNDLFIRIQCNTKYAKDFSLHILHCIELYSLCYLTYFAEDCFFRFCLRTSDRCSMEAKQLFSSIFKQSSRETVEITHGKYTCSSLILQNSVCFWVSSSSARISGSTHISRKICCSIAPPWGQIALRLLKEGLGLRTLSRRQLSLL